MDRDAMEIEILTNLVRPIIVSGNFVRLKHCLRLMKGSGLGTRKHRPTVL